MHSNVGRPAGDMFRVGAEWDITDVIFTPTVQGWEDWEADFDGHVLTDEPEAEWTIEDYSLGQEDPLDIAWSISSAPIYDYPGEEKEALVFINNPTIEPAGKSQYSDTAARLGHAWLRLRRIFEPTYGVLPEAYRPDPQFAAKMIKLRKENETARQSTMFYDQDLDDKIFPATEEQEPVPAVQVNASMPYESEPEAPEHGSWLRRTGEWIKQRRRALGFGAVALSAALLFSDTAPVSSPPTASNQPADAGETQSQPSEILPRITDATDRATDKAEDESTAAASVAEEEILRLTIPDGGNLSWTVEYELVMRGVPDDEHLSGKVANVVRYLQLQRPDRDLGLVYAGEVIEVTLDQELKDLFSAA